MHPNQTPERPAIRKLRELIENRGMAKGLAEGRAEGKAEGKAEGLAEGKRGDLLLIFSERGLPVTARERARIAACADVEQLSAWLRRAITAGSVAEALATPEGSGKPASRSVAMGPQAAPNPAARPRRSRPKTGRRAPG